MNNNRLCPSCRNPLPTNTCRKCGYKEKKLQVVDTQQEFARFSYLQKIRTSAQELPAVKRLSKQEKLSIYLKNYQKLLKRAINTLAEANQLNIATSMQLKQQAKIIWEKFLLKKKDINSPIPGIFKKYIANTRSQPEARPDTQKQPQNQQPQSEPSIEKRNEEQEVTAAKKRGRRGKSKQARQLSVVTQLRCFHNNSVKPLIPQSIQERKLSQDQLTSAQKALLSYLLGLSQVDEEMLKVASYKYLKLLHTINSHKIQKSYIKQTEVSSELTKRRLKPMKTKENSTLLLLLNDVLDCWTSVDLQSGNIRLTQKLTLYERANQRFEVVEAILKELEAEKVSESPNIPQISYELIYAIIYLAVVRTGLTICVGETIASVGRLQIPRFEVEQELYLEAVPNQEVITPQRIRKQAHLLARFLELEFVCYINKWTQKWCQKLDLKAHQGAVELINQTIFEQAKARYNKSTVGEKQNYYRYFELEQDIASLAGVMVFVKMSDGLTDYPYLVLTQPVELAKEYAIDDPQLAILSQFIKKKSITVEDQSKQPLAKNMPEMYQAPLNILGFSKRIVHLNRYDKHLGFETSNSQVVRTRNLSHLNGIGTVKLLQFFKGYQEQGQAQHEIKLRYTEMQQHQTVQKRLKESKGTSIKIINSQDKQTVSLHQNIKNQLGCIVNPQEKIVEGAPVTTLACLVDEPSSNYELLYDYTSDYLLMVDRPEQLWLMEQLCFNNCTYNQFCHWLATYESVLKLYEVQ